jgi:hypothetical protein
MTRDQVVSVRLTDGERQALTDIAATARVSLSELVRRAALALTYPDPPRPGSTSSAALVRLALIPREDTP